MEHRWGERFRVNLTVTVRDSKGWTAVARIRDVSISGAFLECRHEFDSASWITVNFGHGGSAQPVDGYIARLTREGIGIEWAEFAPDAVTDVLRSRASLQRHRPVAHPRRRGSINASPLPDSPPRIPAKPPYVAPGAGSSRGSRRR
jgi:PilZ domain-containing protein